MSIQFITKNEILSNFISIINSQLGTNLLNYMCPDSVLLLKVVYIFIYFIMNDNIIIKLTNGYNEFTDTYLHKPYKAHKAHKASAFITQLYDTITNTPTDEHKQIYIKRGYFTQFAPLSRKVFTIFYDMNRNCANTQTYMPILLGIYIMNMIC
jgi:hypothetical protein